MASNKIIQGVTSSLSLLLIADQAKFMKDNGYDIKLVCNNENDKVVDDLIIKNIPFEREINLKKDLYSLVLLYKYLKKERPYIINFSTPKAGLLGMVAGFLCGIKNRIYIQRGLRLETTSGIKKKILYYTEKIACSLSTHVMVISDSLETELLKQNLVNKDKVIRIGKGSSNGVDLKKYNPDNIDHDRIKILRDKLSLEKSDFVLGYVGRITKDKGIEEMTDAFRLLRREFANAKLLLIGNIENSNSISRTHEKILNNDENIIHVEHTNDLEYYYTIMDILVFPTHREGFGNVSVESQAMRTPVITVDSTGSKDTVKQGETGLIVERKNTTELYQAMKYTIEEPKVLEVYQKNSREFIEKNFDRKKIQLQLLDFYNQL